MDPTRALLDMLEESYVVVGNDGADEDDTVAYGEAKEEQDARDPDVDGVPSYFVLPMTRLKHILSVECKTFAQTTRLLGTHYRFLMSNDVYQPLSVNHVDCMWLMLAKRLAEAAPTERAIEPQKLRNSARNRLMYSTFATELLRCRNENVLPTKLLPIMWRTLSPLNPKGDAEHRDVLRSCTRWLGAMCYANVHIIGSRQVVVAEELHPHAPGLARDLQKLLLTRAKTLPDVFRDSLVAAVRTAHLTVDAALVYEALHPSHGQCDLHMALKAAAGVDVTRMDALSRWVPWPRPVLKPWETLVTPLNAPSKEDQAVIDKPPRWLLEMWQLRVFAFFFHSAFADATGYVPTLGSEGLFLERYAVSWWELMLPTGVVKLETRTRFHAPALPLIIPISSTQCWVRTDTHVYVHPSFVSALACWFECQTELEDGIAIWPRCRSFLPSLPAPPPPLPSLPATPASEHASVAPDLPADGESHFEGDMDTTE